MELKTLAKNTVILASPKVLKFFIGIIRAKFIAIFLGVIGAGIIDQLQDIISQIKNFSLSSLPDGMVKLIAQQNGIEFNQKKVSSIIRTYIVMVMPVTIIITALGYFFSNEITIYVFGDIKYKTYFLIGFLAFPVTVLSTTASALLKAFKEVKSFAIAEALIIIINLIIFIPLIYFFKIDGGVVYVTLSFITVFFVMYFLMRKNVFKKYGLKFSDIQKAIFSKKYFNELLAYMGVGILGGAYFVFSEVATRSIIVNNLGIDKLGIYSPITRWASLFVGFILPSIYTYLYPRLSESKTNNEIIDIINSVFRLITFITLPFVIVGIATRDWIIPLFYSNEFIEASQYLPYHFSTLLFVIWSSILSQLFYATGRLKFFLISGIIINTLSLALVYFLTPDFGLYGYVAKFTIVPIVMLITYFVFWKREIKFNFKKENLTLIFYALACSGVLLLIRNNSVYLQVLSLVLILCTAAFLKENEKAFIIGQIKKVIKK